MFEGILFHDFAEILCLRVYYSILLQRVDVRGYFIPHFFREWRMF